jgi:hypothetical protein
MLSIVRRRATYANVGATLALFLSPERRRRIGCPPLPDHLEDADRPDGPAQADSKPGATGPAGAAGPAGPAGAAGSARAYALVVVNGPGNPLLTENAGFTSVNEPQPGVFCLNSLIPGHAPVVSAAGVEAIFATVSPQQCPGGYEIRTNQEITGGGFSVLVP